MTRIYGHVNVSFLTQHRTEMGAGCWGLLLSVLEAHYCLVFTAATLRKLLLNKKGAKFLLSRLCGTVWVMGVPGDF